MKAAEADSRGFLECSGDWLGNGTMPFMHPVDPDSLSHHAKHTSLSQPQEIRRIVGDT
jgi:hypothetical protein